MKPIPVPELELHQAIGCRLRFLRKRLKTFSQDLSLLLGLNSGALGKYEAARARVPLVVLINTANLFDNADEVLLWLIGRVVGNPPTFNVKEEYLDEIEKLVALREHTYRSKHKKRTITLRPGSRRYREKARELGSQ